MKTLLLLLALAIPAIAQNHYIATASTTALTVQQAAGTNGAQVTFQGASVYCASAQTATLSWNGTAATATTLATLAVPNTFTGSRATAWSGSNVGAGTTGPVYNVPAASTFLIDLGWFAMGNTGSGSNFTITTSGSCTITITWTERQ
jgi:hypothetical protein